MADLQGEVLSFPLTLSSNLARRHGHSARDKSPRHNRVVAEERDNNIDRERYHQLNGYQKSLFHKWVHRQSRGACGLKNSPRSERIAQPRSGDRSKSRLNDEIGRLLHRSVTWFRATGGIRCPYDYHRRGAKLPSPTKPAIRFRAIS
jgi:hypothetical protein